VTDARLIEVVNLDSRQLVGTWPLQGIANFPMALDPTQKFVATVFRAPPQLALIEVSKGQVVVRQPTCGDADDVFSMSGEGGFTSVAAAARSPPSSMTRLATAPSRRRRQPQAQERRFSCRHSIGCLWQGAQA
jgi:hypothetical protein